MTEYKDRERRLRQAALWIVSLCLLLWGCAPRPERPGSLEPAGEEKVSGGTADTGENRGNQSSEAADAGENREGGAVGAGKPSGGAANGNRLKVAVTIFPYYDFTRQVAGDLADLELIVPAGMDSHSFEPTPAHMRAIQEADILICNGGAMEHWVSQVLEAIDAPDLTVVTMMDYVDVLQEEIVEGMEDGDHDEGAHRAGGSEAAAGGPDGHEAASHEIEAASHSPEANEAPHEIEGDQAGSHEAASRGAGDSEAETGGPDGHEAASHSPEADEATHEPEYDEHIWTSPVNAMAITRVITDTLAAADPAHEADYRAGCEAYLEQLDQLHQGFLEVSAARKRDMIIVGDKFPFRYLADEYGLDYRAAFSGCSTDTEPSARTIAYLIDQVREQQIPAVYYLELSSHRVSEIIGEETGAEPLLLHSCHNVTRRELESGVTYMELMRQNVENLRKGLDS